MSLRLVLTFLLVLVAGVASAQTLPPLAPAYTCTGQEPNGDRYTSALELVEEGTVWQLVWTFTTRALFGMGIREGDRFVVTFRDGPGSITGVTIYHIEGAVLRGRWTAFGLTDTFPETCVPRGLQAQR